MAEIRIKRRQGPVWPWILGILFLLAAIWFMVEFVLTEEGIRFESRMDENRNLQEVYPTQTQRIDDFIALVNDRTFVEENIDEVKAREGMLLLSEALEEVIEEQNIQNQEVLADQHVLSEQVNGVNENPAAFNSNINRSFFTAANLMVGIQEEQFPELEREVDEVKKSAHEINPSNEISNQGEKVKEFLIKSGEVLQSMRDGMYQDHGRIHEFNEEVKLINKEK